MTEDDGSESDPFAHLTEAVDDRDGNPFDELADAGPKDTGPDDSGPDNTGGHDANDRDTGGHAAGDDAGDGIQEVTEPQVRPGKPDVDGLDGQDTGESDSDAPPAGQSGEAPDRGDPFAGESVFEQRDVGEVDEDQVWQDLSDAQARGSVRDARDRDYAEVSKHAYCERCEHFTAPPEVRCTHEGTEILEFVAVDTVRVVDCPVVAERRALRRRNESE